MNTSKLVELIEAGGGKFTIHSRCVSASNVPAKYQAELKKQAYLVKCWILERQASRRWEGSGFDYEWWKYPDDVWTPDNKLMVLKATWDELKAIVTDKSRADALPWRTKKVPHILVSKSNQNGAE